MHHAFKLPPASSLSFFSCSSAEFTSAADASRALLAFSWSKIPYHKNVLSLTQMIMMTWMLMLMSTINPSPPATNMQLRCNFSHDGSLFPLVLRRCCLQGPEGTCQYKENDVFFPTVLCLLCSPAFRSENVF